VLAVASVPVVIFSGAIAVGIVVVVVWLDVVVGNVVALDSNISDEIVVCTIVADVCAVIVGSVVVFSDAADINVCGVTADRVEEIGK